MDYCKALHILKSPALLHAWISWPIFSYSSYMIIASFMRSSPKVGTVIDVGSNAGQFAVAASKMLEKPTIYSFEPNPESALDFARNTRDLSNIQLYQVGLGDVEGKRTFHQNTYSHSSSFLRLSDSHRKAFPFAKERDDIKVDISTLDAVFNTIKIKSPVLLKLDVQGFEPFVLRGGERTLNKVDYVIMELSFSQLYEGEKLFSDMLMLMRDYGFDFSRPVGMLNEPGTREILQMDALFTRARP